MTRMVGEKKRGAGAVTHPALKVIFVAAALAVPLLGCAAPTGKQTRDADWLPLSLSKMYPADKLRNGGR